MMQIRLTKKTVTITALTVVALAFSLFSLAALAIHQIDNAYLDLKRPFAVIETAGPLPDGTRFVLLEDPENVELWIRADCNQESPTYGCLFLRRDRNSSGTDRDSWAGQKFKLEGNRRVNRKILDILMAELSTVPRRALTTKLPDSSTMIADSDKQQSSRHAVLSSVITATSDRLTKRADGR